MNGFTEEHFVNFPITSRYIQELIKQNKKDKPTRFDDLEIKHQIRVLNVWFDIIYLDLYTLVTWINKTFFYVIENDKNSYLKVVGKDLKSFLRSYIKKGLAKGGISFLLNTYTGFDTEYKYLEGIRNQLLSVQLAVVSRVVMKIPSVIDIYRMRSVNTLSNVSYKPLEEVLGGKLNVNYINDLININIKFVRELLYPSYDESIKKLVNGLIKEGIPFTEKNDNMFFMFDKSLLKTWFSLDVAKGVSLTELVNQSDSMSKNDLDVKLGEVYELLKRIFNNDLVDLVDLEDLVEDVKGVKSDKKLEGIKTTEINVKKVVDFSQHFKESVETLDSVEKLESIIPIEKPKVLSKKFKRTYKQTFTPEKVSVTLTRNNYFVGHYTAADLSILKDYEVFKNDFDIVNKSMVSLKKPYLVGDINVIMRDAMLLCPGTSNSLAALGKMYDFPKIDIGDWITKMDKLLVEDFNLFKDYAIQDAKIALLHGVYMEEFAFKLGMIGVPLSLSMLSSSHLRKFWQLNNYEGYQINPEYLINDSAKTQTPRGLFSVGDVGHHISKYIASYKGGRNESFMYGIDDSFKWVDYDLTSAYTSGMSLMGDPDYKNARIISKEELAKIDTIDIIRSYTCIQGKFKFPKDTKYPSIPCFVDETTTVYPLEGECHLTGPEYILALEQCCEIIFKEICYIPMKKYASKDPKEELTKEQKDQAELLMRPFYVLRGDKRIAIKKVKRSCKKY